MRQRFRTPIKCFFFVLLWPALAHSQDCPDSQSKIAVRADMAIIGGTNGSTVLHIQNLQTAALSLDLTAGPFVSRTARNIVSGAKVEFGPGNGNASLSKSLPQGASIDVSASISNDGAVGISTSRIFNAGICVGELQAIRYDAPLNFVVEGDGTSASPLQAQAKKEIVIAFKNNDDLTYPISPSLYLDGKEIVSQKMIIGPNSSASLRFTLRKKWFDLGTWFRPRPVTIQLFIPLTRSEFGNAPSERVLQSRTIPITAQLVRLPRIPSQFVVSIVVFLVLLLGGLASLATNAFLPNVLKKLACKKRLQFLADGTSAVSVKVDSRLRVLLRLERNRLLKLLASSSFLSSDADDIFQQVDTGITALGKRLTVAQRLDELRNHFDLHSDSCPPSVSDNIDQHLQEAADQLRSLYLTEQSLTNANAALDTAERVLSSLENGESVGKDIAARHQKLLQRVAALPGSDPYLAELEKALPGIFSVLTLTYDDAHPVLQSNFMEIDDSIARVHVALDYAYIRSTTREQTIQDRFEKRKSDLIGLLGTRDWRSLRAARDLAQQMRQNIYVEDLLEDLQKQKACIDVNQQVARPYSPLEFSICFKCSAYNHAEALQELTCNWIFDDDLTETGWAVCHYFETGNIRSITADIPMSLPTRSSSQVSTNSQPTSVKFEKKLEVRPTKTSFSRPKMFAEALRFVIAFFLALVGLVAGAQDQLAKLDVLPALIAIFLLGFAADSIKNILAQPAQAPPSPGK